MGRFFAPDFGELEITPFYSDNEPYCQEVRFSIPYEHWPQFEKTPEFRMIKEYCAALKARYKTSQCHEPEHEPETERTKPRSTPSDRRESFWVRVRGWFQRPK